MLRLALLMCLLVLAGLAAGSKGQANPYAAWPKSFPGGADFFPIAVWMQSPANAQAYHDIGVNTYVALAGRLTDESEAAMTTAGIRVVTGRSRRAGVTTDRAIVAAWMHGDEPDNAQAAEGGGWGPAIPPAKIIADYQAIRAADPSRPVLLNLGQQVANDEWYGRGCEVTDYPEYVKGGDIISFDVYPVVGIDKPDGENYLWYVAKGMHRLQRWTKGEKIVWDCIETTHINDPDRLPTPQQVRAEVWMSLVHGSLGIIYFCHEFKPAFIEAGLLAHPEISAAVKQTNQQIHDLAPVLNSPTLPDGAVVTTSNPLVPIDLMAKQYQGATYVFAVGMRNAETNGRFRIPGLAEGTVEVIGEGRTMKLEGHEFRDGFKAYEVHLYRVVGE
jgi:hypothetical protein